MYYNIDTCVLVLNNEIFNHDNNWIMGWMRMLDQYNYNVSGLWYKVSKMKEVGKEPQVGGGWIKF